MSSPIIPDLKNLSLDVIERLIFWVFAAYVVSKILSFIGFSYWFMFFTIVIVSWSIVIVLDGIKVDPKGRAVLITGCDTGFGNAVARRLHDMGYSVFAGVYSTSTEGAQALQKEYGQERMFVFEMNVTKDEDCERALKYVEENLPSGAKGLWAVITNAGWSTFGEVEWVPMDVHQKIVDINLFGTIRTIRAALPLLRRGHGRVITMSSMCGRFGAPSRSAYTATKWAVEGLSECLRAEMKRWNVHVVVIEPGNFVAGTALYAGNAVIQQGEHMWNNLSPRVQNDYTKEYFDSAIEKMRGYTVGGNCSVEPVIQTLADAVTHSFPQTRYQIMSPAEKVKCFIATHLPSVFYDIFYN